ncbi:TrbG/VirB9 family P-type conjugative transfer protein [Salmonella enterica]|nr:TrbG/VirB9 family P-type conjugative transfer protein [Salmonella enterica]
MLTKKTLAVLSALAVVTASFSAAAQQCRVVNWRPGTIIKVQSSLYLGTRIELPEGSMLLTKEPFSSNALWASTGAANQVMIQPSSDEPEGLKTMVTVFMTNGQTLDVEAVRVPQSQNQQCVQVRGSGLRSGDRVALNNTYSSGASGADVARLQNELNSARLNNDTERKNAVLEALRRYRYFIYTRYNWQTGKGFSGKNVISDVYDDGRFTYIRVSRPNRGLMAVQAEVGGKTAIVPTKYDDAYGIYQMSGIYPKFTLTLDGVKLDVIRADNASNGES